MIRHIETLLGAFRQAVGPDVGIALDLNFNMKPEAAIRICRALASLDLMWVEIDMYDAAARSARSRTSRRCRSARARTSTAPRLPAVLRGAARWTS